MLYFVSGAIWTKVKTSFDWWEVDIIFRVTGRGRIGADGLVCGVNIRD
jgi:mannose-binding lectin 1